MIYKDEKRGIKNATSDMKIFSFMYYPSNIFSGLKVSNINQTPQKYTKTTLITLFLNTDCLYPLKAKFYLMTQFCNTHIDDA